MPGRPAGNRGTGGQQIWSGWDGVGTAAVTLVGPIAYFTRACCNASRLHRTRLRSALCLIHRLSDLSSVGSIGCRIHRLSDSSAEHSILLSEATHSWRQPFQITSNWLLTLMPGDQPKCRRCVHRRVHPKAAVQFPSLLCRQALATIHGAAFPDLDLPGH